MRAIDPADRAIELLKRTRDLLFECRTAGEGLAEPPADSEPPAVAGERTAYGVLVAALEEGLVKTLEHAIDVLRRFSAPAGPSSGEWFFCSPFPERRRYDTRPWLSKSKASVRKGP